jgi:hypothetical protein
MQANTHITLRAGVIRVVPPAAGGSPAAAEGGTQLDWEGDMPGYEYMLVDVSSWEFGLMHQALAEFKRQGWEVAEAFGIGQPKLRPGGGLMIRLRRPARGRAHTN